MTKTKRMKREDLLNTTTLDSRCRGNAQEVSQVSVAKFFLLRKIINRLNELRGQPYDKDEVRQYIDLTIKGMHREKIWRLNLAIRRVGLIGLLEQLYLITPRHSNQADDKQSIAGIMDKLSQYPCETWQEIFGVYLRMKRNANTIKAYQSYWK